MRSLLFFIMVFSYFAWELKKKIGPIKGSQVFEWVEDDSMSR